MNADSNGTDHQTQVLLFAAIALLAIAVLAYVKHDAHADDATPQVHAQPAQVERAPAARDHRWYANGGGSASPTRARQTNVWTHCDHERFEDAVRSTMQAGVFSMARQGRCAR